IIDNACRAVMGCGSSTALSRLRDKLKIATVNTRTAVARERAYYKWPTLNACMPALMAAPMKSRLSTWVSGTRKWVKRYCQDIVPSQAAKALTLRARKNDKSKITAWIDQIMAGRIRSVGLLELIYPEYSQSIQSIIKIRSGCFNTMLKLARAKIADSRYLDYCPCCNMGVAESIEHMNTTKKKSLITTEASINTNFITLSEIADKNGLDEIIDAYNSQNTPKIYQNEKIKKKENYENYEKIEKLQVIEEPKNKTSNYGKIHHKVFRGKAPARNFFAVSNPGSIAPISLPTTHPSADGAATKKKSVILDVNQPKNVEINSRQLARLETTLIMLQKKISKMTPNIKSLKNHQIPATKGLKLTKFVHGKYKLIKPYTLKGNIGSKTTAAKHKTATKTIISQPISKSQSGG
ncbi:hypothetical protein BB561_006109, partial [Smittium simulii]